MQTRAALFAAAFAAVVAGCGSEWNDPYPAADRGKNFLYSSFIDRPKTLDPARSVNRRWTLSPASAAGATWSATFNYPTSDVDVTADPNTFLVQVYNGATWSSPIRSTR